MDHLVLSRFSFSFLFSVVAARRYAVYLPRLEWQQSMNLRQSTILCYIESQVMIYISLHLLLWPHQSSHPSNPPVVKKQAEEAFSSRNSSSMTGMQPIDKANPISGYRSWFEENLDSRWWQLEDSSRSISYRYRGPSMAWKGQLFRLLSSILILILDIKFLERILELIASWFMALFLLCRHVIFVFYIVVFIIQLHTALG